MLATYLAQVVYISSLAILTTQPEPSRVDSQRCLCAFLRPGEPQLWPASLSSAPVWFGLCELGKHQGPFGSQLAHPHRVGPGASVQILSPLLGLTTVKCLPLYILLIN